MKYLFLGVITLLLVLPVHSNDYRVHSPDTILAVRFLLEHGKPYYFVERFNREIIKKSALGLELKEGASLRDGFVVKSVERDHHDETWTQVWGEKKQIRNHYNELRVNLIRSEPPDREISIVFRVYDDGVGFRYEVPEQPGLGAFMIMDELTEFTLTGDHDTWWIGAYQWNRFEYLYEKTPLSKVDTAHTHLTMKTKDGLYLSIHEAALVNYSTMALKRTNQYTLRADLFPWADGVRVRAKAPMVSPWRTIQISDTPGGLITSFLILNLNEPNKIEDTSWIKPAKYVGIWWEMHLNKSTWGSGPNHGATTENAKRYIDFAAEHGFNHILVEGWNIGWDGDWYGDGAAFNFTTPYPDFDLNDVAQYALTKGVRLMGHHETSANVLNYEKQMEDAFALYERLGVRAVKTGYVGHGTDIVWYDEDGNANHEWHHGQFMVEHHQRVIELAARHKISLNVHEGVKDTGLRRTWPNMMTREVARGQEYNAWGGDGGNPPDHVVIIPFTRNLSGPFDYTPGIVELYFEEFQPNNRINSTLAKELALYVIIYSPLQMASDFPENYEAKPDVFQFIKDVPADWYDTRVLHASIGNYVTIVRKDLASDDWYLGSITDENGRLLEASLSFLDPGKKYVAEIYRDGGNADWVYDPYDIVIEKRIVHSGTRLSLRLAASGGQAIRFRPATDDDLHLLEEK
jgi:alpha-glucosidase